MGRLWHLDSPGAAYWRPSRARACSRRTYFCILPVLVLGRGPKTTLLGTLKRAMRSRQKAMMSASVADWSGFEGDEGAGGFAPFLAGAGDDGGFEDGGVAVEDVFHLDGGDVLATGDDDVFRAVADFDVAVLVPDGEVSGVGTSRLRRLRRWRPGS